MGRAKYALMDSYGSDYEPGPPAVHDVEIDDDGERISINWDATEEFMTGEFAPSYYFAIQLYCDDERMGEVEFVDENNFVFHSPDRFKKYAAEVWSVDEEGDTGDPVRSDWHMIGVEEYGHLMKQLSKYDDLLEKTIKEETDMSSKSRLEELHEIISEFDDYSVSDLQWEEEPASPSMDTLRGYEEELRQLIPLPDIIGVKITKDKMGDMFVSWTANEWPRNLQTCVKVYSNGGHEGDCVVIESSKYHIVSPDPTKKYHVELWCVDGDKAGKRKKSDEIMICKDLGKVLVNYTKRIRVGHSVFEGYLKGACGQLEKVAVKIVESNEKLKRELVIAEELKPHQNTVLYLGSGDIDDGTYQAYIILELCKKETLHEMVENSKLLGTKGKIALLHVMLGLSFIHCKNVKHRDLKPRNILCSLTGENLKIADFGLSKQGTPCVSKSAPMIGTEGWGSPESYIGTTETMSDKSDIYSAGLVFYFVLSDGSHAFGFRSDRWTSRIIDGADVNYSLLVCDDAQIARDVIEKMLGRSPDSRPTSQEVLAHPFFWDERRKLDFLRMIAKIFARFTYSRNRIEPEGIVRTVKDELESNGEIIQAENGKKNWIERLKDYAKDKNRLVLVLEKAMEQKMKYNPCCVFHLLRFIRNTHEHFSEGNLKTVFKNSRDIWRFFSELFPKLFCTVYNATSSQWAELKACPDFPDDADDLLKRPPFYRPLVYNRKRKLEQ